MAGPILTDILCLTKALIEAKLDILLLLLLLMLLLLLLLLPNENSI